MSKKSRDKGSRFELAVVKALQSEGIGAEKVPLSGAAGGRFSADITVPVLGTDERFECKCRASGFKQIREWLSGNYALVTKADRQEPLVTLRLKDFARLARLSDEQRAILADEEAA